MIPGSIKFNYLITLNIGKFYSYKADDGIAILKMNDSIFYTTESSGLQYLPIEDLVSIDKLVIKYPLIYAHMHNHNRIDFFNVLDNELFSIDYRIPRVNNSRLNIKIDDDVIWIYRPNQLAFVKKDEKTTHNIQFRSDQKFQSLLYDQCNVYMLYNKSIEVISKNEIINETPIFDLVAYRNELKEYFELIKYFNIGKQTNIDTAMDNLKHIREAYANTENPEIKASLNALNTRIFNSVDFNTEESYVKCYSNLELPNVQRIECYKKAVFQNVRNGSYNDVLTHRKKFEAFDVSKNSRVAYLNRNIDSISKYLFILDSLKSVEMPKDSFDYLQALNLKLICNTSFYCHEGCGGCDYSLVINRLVSFASNYPNSFLIDNAKLELMNLKGAYEIYPDTSYIRTYRDFIVENPNSDILKDAKLKYLMLLHDYVDHNSSESLMEDFVNGLKEFLSRYPNHDNINYVEMLYKAYKNN